MENAKKLAYERAWYKKISNTTIEQLQAIEGWRQTIRQIGSTRVWQKSSYAQRKGEATNASLSNCNSGLGYDFKISVTEKSLILKRTNLT